MELSPLQGVGFCIGPIELVIGSLSAPLLGNQDHFIDVASLQGQQRNRGIVSDAETDRLEVWLVADLFAFVHVVAIAAFQNDFLAAGPRLDGVRAAGYRIVLKLHMR